MSRCYRISVSESLRRHIEVDDGIETRLELLDILPPEQMRELLARQLVERGYAREGDVLTREIDGGVEVRVDLVEGSVHVGVKAELDLELKAQRTSSADVSRLDAAKKQLGDALQGELAKEADAATESLRREATRRLEASLEGVRGELDQAIHRATADALKQKARQLGEVQEITEDPETGAVTIRVRV